jgi:hypothetical protein
MNGSVILTRYCRKDPLMRGFVNPNLRVINEEAFICTSRPDTARILHNEWALRKRTHDCKVETITQVLQIKVKFCGRDDE